MCKILDLPKGLNVPMNLLENAVWNNPHGYGLMIRKSATELKVIKELPEGGTDPKEIDKLLRKYDKYHRILHLRWKTEGDVSLDNTHPFLVYDRDGVKVYFAHNGTLHDFKPMGEDKRCDSKVFADDILKPLLDQFDGQYGNDFVKKVIMKFWGYSSASKGVLVSNKYTPCYINFSDWKDIKIGKNDDGTDITFKASNDTYFEKLTRGYEFDRREEERKASQSIFSFQQNTGNSGSANWPIVQLKDIDLRPNHFITPELQDIFSDSDLYTEIGTASLANLTESEIITFVNKQPDMAAALLFHVTGMYDSLLNDFLKVSEKHEKASKRIATLLNKPESEYPNEEVKVG